MKRVLALLALAVSAPSFADDGAPPVSHWNFQLNGAFLLTNPSAQGGELGIVLLTRPFAGRDFYAGPRVGGMFARGTRTDLAGQEYKFSRFDALAGLEGTLWFGNLIGPGFGVDLVAPNYEDRVERTAHARIETFTSVRMARWGESGAWAGRVGVTYSTLDRWGVKFGFTLQFSGVDVTTAE